VHAGRCIILDSSARGAGWNAGDVSVCCCRLLRTRGGAKAYRRWHHFERKKWTLTLRRTDENQGPVGIRRQLLCAGKPPSAPSLACIVTFMQDETLQPWRNAILSASHEILPAVVGEFLIWPCDRVSDYDIWSSFRLQMWLIRLFRERTYLSG
jgi:hypothetical protein